MPVVLRAVLIRGLALFSGIQIVVSTVWPNKTICKKTANKNTNTSYVVTQSSWSTAHALISLLHEWMETLDAGGSVRTMFVDFLKAFDHVDHNLLISKLLSYDIPHCIIRWVHSYLSHRRQRVCVNGELSAWTRLIGDMPQGSWLGPLYIFGSN